MIKLRDILLLIEDVPTTVKDAFGKIAFGSMKPVSVMQGKRSTEKNTEFEKELLEILRSWVKQSNNFNAQQLYSKFDILKKAAEVFPTVLKPSTPNGTEIYRGLNVINQELLDKIIETEPDDYEKTSVSFRRQSGTPAYKYKTPINYTPRRPVQSWTSDLDVAGKFTSHAIISTKQNDEFLFNQKLMNHLFKKDVEEEVLHFGTEYSEPIYITISENIHSQIVRSKLLNNLQEPTTKEEVVQVLSIIGIDNNYYTKYTISDDLTVDVEGDIWLSETKVKGLTKIPVKFGTVSGNFTVSNIPIKSLKNAPKKVGGRFTVMGTKIETLEGGPIEVRGEYEVQMNKLKSLKGAPKEIGGGFWCHKNELTTLEGGPISVGGTYSCRYNKLTTLKGAPQHVNDSFNADFNELKTLEGCPDWIGVTADFRNNPLISFDGIGGHIGKNLYADSDLLPDEEITKLQNKRIVHGTLLVKPKS